MNYPFVNLSGNLKLPLFYRDTDVNAVVLRVGFVGERELSQLSGIDFLGEIKPCDGSR